MKSHYEHFQAGHFSPAVCIQLSLKTHLDIYPNHPYFWDPLKIRERMAFYAPVIFRWSER